ncbi:DUF1205 domain-containing protein [Asanoa iriomotensis]
MVPLARACQAVGHTVAVASQPGLCEAIRQAGLPAVSVGSDVDTVSVFRGFVLAPDRPAWTTGRSSIDPPAGPRPAGPGSNGGSTRPPRVLDLFGRLADVTAGPLLRFGRRWQPDLVIHDPTEFAGPVVASALGVRAIRHLYGLDLMYQLRRFLPAVVAPVAERLGVSNVDVVDAPTIDPCPTDFQLRVDYQPIVIRNEQYHGLPQPPCRPLDPPRRPRVCITWGTTIGRLGGASLHLAGDVARALAPLDADLVVAVTPEQASLLGELPAGVRVVEGTPLSALLPDCTAVVHHGGAGTTLACLRYGLPQLAVPQLPDHALHSRQMVGAGAGITLNRQLATADRLRDAVVALLSEPSHRDRAEQMADQMRLRPRPPDIAALLAS